MSRDLTVYRGRRDQDPPGMSDKVERIMKEQGVSEPVARNLIKYSKFGIGPMAGGQLERPSMSMPSKPAPSMRDAVEEKKRKLQEAEERLQEQEKARADSEAQEAVPFSPFEQAVRPRAKAASSKPRLGLISLGAVQARPESIDPLKKVDVPAAGDAPEPDDREGDSASAKPEELPRSAASSSHAKREGEQRRVFAEDRKQAKKKKKRKRDDSSGEEPARDGAQATSRAQKEVAPRTARARSPSAASEPADQPPAQARPAGSLMTEAEVRAMMGKDKGKKNERGSARAKARIQKEMQEWESTKNSNPEFWKAPKFALCFSAETKKNRNF